MTGDREAFATLVREVSNGLFAVACRMLRDIDLANDALQNTLITAWRKLPDLREPDRFEAWTYRILVNACHAEAERRRRWTGRVTELVGEGPSASDTSQALADRDQVERIFRRLPIEQRAVFVLHHHRGLSLVEIADLLGIPAGTARSRLHYATRALRVAFLDEAAVGLPAVRPT
jgi:RNA polymerase sigma-70 factor (ECF subfamily)